MVVTYKVILLGAPSTTLSGPEVTRKLKIFKIHCFKRKCKLFIQSRFDNKCSNYLVDESWVALHGNRSHSKASASSCPYLL